MKKIILIAIFILFEKANCQINFRFDTNSFILGLMDDYNGRTVAFESKESASYIGSTKPELSRMFSDSICKVYKISKSEITEKQNSFFNEKIATQINNFYLKYLDEGMDYYNEKTQQSYKVHTLILDEHKFIYNYQKLSFLAGIFYNFGKLDNGEVIFKTANSSNFNTAVHFISDLGFNYCEKAKKEYNIPTVQEVTFVPSEEYIDFFKTLEKKRINGW